MPSPVCTSCRQFASVPSSICPACRGAFPAPPDSRAYARSWDEPTGKRKYADDDDDYDFDRPRRRVGGSGKERTGFQVPGLKWFAVSFLLLLLLLAFLIPGAALIAVF